MNNRSISLTAHLKQQRSSLFGIAALLAALAASPTASFGASIGINYARGGDHINDTNVNSLAASARAGAPGFEQENWNNLGRYGAGITLKDSTGAATPVTVNWDATGSYSLSGGTASDQGSPDGNLMNSYLDSNGSANVALTNSIYGNNANNKPLVYLSGLSAWLAAASAQYYDVVIYSDGDATSGRTGEYWIMEASGPSTNLVLGTDLTSHVFVRDVANFISTLSYTEVPLTSVSGIAAANGNYTVFKGLSSDSVLIRTAEYNTRAPINAIQIVPRAQRPPADLAPLQSAVVYPGATARFRVTAAGLAPITYQWRKNGAPLSDAGNISGATTPTLTVANASAADVATYTVVVTNPGGSATSTDATLSLTNFAAGSYAQQIATNSPYAYWRLNEMEDLAGGTAVAHDFIGGFNGTYGFAAANLLQGINGPLPPAFPGFEAGNGALQSANNTWASWVTVPPLNLATNTVTMSMWIYPTAAQAQYTGLLIHRNGNDVAGLAFGANNQLGYTWNTNAAATYNFASGLVVPTNMWSYVALVVSPSDAVLYLYNANGTASATNAIDHGVSPFAGAALIGSDSFGTGRTFVGSIDEVAIWRRSLSEVELYGNYKRGLGLSAIAASITTSPQPVTLMAGRTARFTVSALGDAPLSYRWRKGGGNLSNGGNISGATSTTLVISNVSSADAGNYDVVVSNPAGSATSASAALSVVASNSAPVAYEAALRNLNPIAYWRLNEASGTIAYDYWSGIAATHENVTLGQPAPQAPVYLGLESTNTSASYDGVSSSSSVGSSLMNNLAQFSILGWFNSALPPSARLGLFGQNDVAEFGFHANGDVGIWTPGGGSAFIAQSNIVVGEWYFVAAVGNGSQIGVYLFSTNGVLQAVSSATTTNYGNSLFPFRIGGGGILDATGNYFLGQIDEVAVFNRALSVGELATLYGAASTGGLLAPAISVQPVSRTAYAQQDATLSVSALGSEPLQYQWRRNGAPLSNGGNISGVNTATLAFDNLTAANAGNYDVVITSPGGTITSSNAVLAVISPDSDSYEAAVIALQPYSYWRLNETTDIVANDYFGGRNGTYGTATQMGVPGVLNPPFVGFEATNVAVRTTVATANSYVSVPLGSISTNTATFTAWVYPVGTQEGWSGILTSRGGTAGGGVGYNGDQMLSYTWNNNSTWSFVSGLVIPSNMWSFVSVVISPDRAVLGLQNANGSAFATNVLAHTSDVFGNTWLIGRDNNANADDGSRTFNGTIDEVAVFLRSLSPAEIQELFTSGMSGRPVRLSLERSGNNIILSWPSGTLLQADQANGPFTPVPNATSPYTHNIGAGNKFFRVQQ